MGREHWVEIELGKILETTSGGTPSRSNSNLYKGNIPWLKSGELNDGIITNSEEFISEEALEKSSAKLFPKGTILIALYGATLGKLGILGIPSATNQAICAIFSCKNINDKYIFSFLFSERDNLIKAGFGAAQPNISQLTIRSIKVPLPPLAEQQRIVEKLDAILPRVKAAKARLEKMSKILKRFRQSLLAAACSGKLTEDWRQKNPENTNDINNPEVATHDFDLPEGWKVGALKNIADCRLGKMLDKSKNKGKEVKYLRNTNVRWMTFELQDVSTLLAEIIEIEKLSIRNGDVLICEGGEPGRAAVWNLGENEFIFQKALHRVRLIDYALPQWLVFNLKNDSNNESLSELFTGTTIKHLTGQSLAKYKIPLPSLPEQQEIVRRVEKLFALADSLEAKYKKAMQRIEKIEQSVLAKAFRGELAAQDPNDEPAEVLLQRILAEKSIQQNKGKTKKTLKYPDVEQPQQIAAEGAADYRRKGRLKN